MGSGSHGQVAGGINLGLEELSEAGAEFAVEDGAADLEQEVGATTGPAHLLGFGHAAVDQEVGRCPQRLKINRISCKPERNILGLSIFGNTKSCLGFYNFRD